MYSNYGGYICACCGETNPDFLTIDHVNRDGAKHRKQMRGASNLLGWLINNNYPPGYQILCYNCNCGRERNPPHYICPHENEMPEGYQKWQRL